MTNAAYADIFKIWSDFKPPFAAPSFDFNSIFTIQRRNIEALTAANQVMAEGIQAVTRRQAEIARSNVEQAIKATREIIATGSPEGGAAKQADFAKGQFEKTLTNLREVSEMVTKSGFEAFDLLNKRIAETFEEISDVVSSTTPKKSKKN